MPSWRPPAISSTNSESVFPRTFALSFALFQNGSSVASYVGLTPAPYDSGDTKHDQGINKAGNTRARLIAVQMAWLWLRYQSKSELSLWYYRRVGDLKGRVRRIMMIALARKLVIALWRYVETGKVPTGAIVTT